jgi:nitroreductase
MRKAGALIVVYVKKGITRDFFIMSASNAAENILLAAHSKGLGSVWIGYPRMNPKGIDKLVKPGIGWELLCVIALGWPKYKPPSQENRSRKTLDQISKITLETIKI